ncbi:MAG: hypothetical protein R2745_22315 [Vicinamibacterales bacterium]
MLAKAAVIALTAAACTGCIRSATLIKVKADGSGTVEQTVLMNTALMKGMFNGLGGQPSTTPGAMSDADMQRAASRLGEGVTFVSNTPMKTDDGFEGSTAVFAFTDVTKLRVDQDPSLNGSSTGGISTPPKDGAPVTFAFDKGDGASTLTVTLHDKPQGDAPAAAPTGGPDMDNPQMLEMMKSMFKGFKVGIDIEVAGKILKTNADHVSGSRVTLLEMDMETLLQDEAKLKQVQKMLGPTASVSELKPYLKDVKGLKVNDPVVSIQFR